MSLVDIVQLVGDHSLPANYVEPDGAVNYDVTTVLVDGTRQLVSASAATLGSLAGNSLRTAIPGLRSLSVSFDAQHRVVSERVGSTPATRFAAAGEAVDPVAGQPDSAGPPGVPTSPCQLNWSTDVTYQNRPERFLNLYISRLGDRRYRDRTPVSTSSASSIWQ